MSSPSDTTVIVGISGGVDSAVAATLLVEQGYRVQGLHMTNWDEDDDYCEAAKDYQEARRVCADLEIPLHHVNFAAEYREKVFADFLDEYRKGRTPNPDVACNRQIKFGDCLAYAERLGADMIATGHYARVSEDNGRHYLLKGVDAGKDQIVFRFVNTRSGKTSLSPRALFRAKPESPLPLCRAVRFAQRPFLGPFLQMEDQKSSQLA